MAAPRKPNADRVLNVALDLAAAGRWRDVTLTDIAEAANTSLAQLRRVYPSKTAIISAFVERVDLAVLDGTAADDADEPIRERLLDVLLRRLDALNPHKDAVAAIVRDAGSNPAGVLCMAPRLMQSMAWSLEAAGIGSAGLRGRMRTKALAAIYVGAVMTWLRDETPDMGPTTAYLDRALKRAEDLEMLLSGRRRAAPDAEPA